MLGENLQSNLPPTLVKLVLKCKSIIAREVLSRVLEKLVECGLMKPDYVHKNPPHVLYELFADDTVIFTNESRYSLKNIGNFLKSTKICQLQESIETNLAFTCLKL